MAGMGLGEFRQPPTNFIGQSAVDQSAIDVELLRARERDIAEAKALAERGILPSSNTAVADYRSELERQGVPEGIMTPDAGMPAPAQEMSDADFARQYMAQNPEGLPMPSIPARGGGSPLGDVRREMREGFEAMGEAQAATAEAQAEGRGRAADIVSESRDRIESQQQDILETMEAKRRAEESFARDQMRRQETYQATVANRERGIQQDMEKLKNAKIDPNGFFRGEDGEIDWGTKVGASIAMALSAVGSALAGGPNIAKEIIDGAIQRDMRAQAANLENQRAALDEKKSALGRYMDQFSDERSAFAAARGTLIQGYADQISMAKEGIQDAEQLRQLDLLEQQYRTEAQTLITGAAQRQAELDMQSAETEAGLIGQEETIRNQRTQRAATRQSMRAKGQPGASRLPTGYEGNPPTEKALNDVVSMAGTIEEALVAVKDLQSHVDEKGHTLPFTDADAAGKSKATNLQMIAKDMFELGVLTGPDMELIENVVPSDPGAFRQGRVRAQLQEAEGLIKRKADAFMRARGVRRTDPDSVGEQLARGR